jgi:hypothetical protein
VRPYEPDPEHEREAIRRGRRFSAIIFTVCVVLLIAGAITLAVLVVQSWGE